MEKGEIIMRNFCCLYMYILRTLSAAHLLVLNNRFKGNFPKLIHSLIDLFLTNQNYEDLLCRKHMSISIVKRKQVTERKEL